MVGDYIATAFMGGSAVPVFPVAIAPNQRALQESIEVATLSLQGRSAGALASNDRPEVNVSSDRRRQAAPLILP